jgi:4'-phosphopantetheinyl transferase
MMSNDIDLWIEDLSVSENKYDEYWTLLDTDEQEKASRFVHDIHRHRYIIAHGKLRLILASYLDLNPSNIHFAFGKFGKPLIADKGLSTTFNFNMSHSGDKMIVAIGRYDYLGVDIEAWDKKTNHMPIANQCFADSEKAAWLGFLDDQKLAMFYQLWTRKESFAKATGAGITLDVSKVVSSTGSKATHFVSIPDCYGKADEWKLVDLTLTDSMSGALTIKTNQIDQITINNLTV